MLAGQSARRQELAYRTEQLAAESRDVQNQRAREEVERKIGLSNAWNAYQRHKADIAEAREKVIGESNIGIMLAKKKYKETGTGSDSTSVLAGRQNLLTHLNEVQTAERKINNLDAKHAKGLQLAKLRHRSNLGKVENIVKPLRRISSVPTSQQGSSFGDLYAGFSNTSNLFNQGLDLWSQFA